MTQTTCALSGEPFVVSDAEKSLREKFGFGETIPRVKPRYRFQELGAFWPHWNLHTRTCQKTNQRIISIFRPDCPYPVWHRDTWIKDNAPPQTKFDPSQSFFDQAWDLFRSCPLPHHFQSHNQNCEYADDFYHSKNCYLCHSGEHNEDTHYSIYGTRLKDCRYCVFSTHSELCFDLVNSHQMYASVYAIHCHNVQDSAFVYDCRGCRDCLFCFNLRNKQYCFGNQQLSKEAYEAKKKEWDLASHQVYEKAKAFFAQMMETQAFHKAVSIEKSENTTGNFLENCNNCENCYELTDHDGCVNDAVSGPGARSTLDAMGTVGTELTFYSVMNVFSYETRFSFEINQCRFCDYCAYCFNCEECFGCCGLFKGKYCIFNKPYPEAEYRSLKEKIITHMKESGQWGHFFPGHFAPNPYDESLSGFRFPLSEGQQENRGFRYQAPFERQESSYRLSQDLPDHFQDITSDTEKAVFWDGKASRPFQIQKADIAFAQKRHVPLPSSHYITRLQENEQWMPWNGELRPTTCSKTGQPTTTAWPKAYDGRILCEKAYLEMIG